jgi:hypothetical protein
MASDPIPEVLTESSDLNEILWNFIRLNDKKRLTLKDNPHFYEMLPTSAYLYDGNFRIDPIENFHHEIYQERISVLTDSPHVTGRMILEIAEETRVYDKIWVPRQAIIFKGSYLSVFLFSTP